MSQPSYLVLSQYREASAYMDLIGQRYHFPKKYFNVMTLPDAKFIYYEPAKRGKGEYFGYGEVGKVLPDPNQADHFFADILSYRPFGSPVSALDAQGVSRESESASYNPQNAVRKIEPEIFSSICLDGGLDLEAQGVETENSESDEPIVDPFDPSRIKVGREPASIFQVLRKIGLNEIVLNPDFQRNLVWDPVRRSRLIESVLLQIPLPAFYFDGIESRKWSVIDGLQRLSTLDDFITKKNFRLVGLEYLTKAEGKTFDELPRGMQRDLEETQITLFIIRPDTPPEVKFTIFYRINTGGLVLTPQEIRHALFQGAATRLLKALAESPTFRSATDWGVSDTRMDARECVLRYLAFRIHPYTTYAKPELNSFLSGAMKEINAMSSGEIDRLSADFIDAMKRSEAILGRRAFRKFNPMSGRRGPINKALFESWANVLQEYEQDKLEAAKERIVKSLGEAFAADADYLRALSAGTGGVRSVKDRFEAAHNIVRRALQ